MDEAIACYRTAITLDPKHATTHVNLGVALAAKGQLDEAIACYRTAITLDPKSAMAHSNLGGALHDKGQLDEAIACYRTAITLDPKFAMAHCNLGSGLKDKGQPDDAIAEYRTAITLDPTCAMAHSNLGVVLWYDKGQLDDAIAAGHRATELGFEPARQFLAQAERAAAARDKFADFENGRYKPATTYERLGMAVWCQTIKRHHTATRLYADTFAADPKAADLEDGHHFNAACAPRWPPLASTKTPRKPDSASRPSTGSAPTWPCGPSNWKAASPPIVPRCRRVLRHWKQDGDLAGIRDSAALAKLPAEERTACEQLWTDVAALLKRAQEGTSTAR